jgi:hypothetical protein
VPRADKQSTRLRLTTARPPACNNCGRCSRCRRWTEPEDEFVDTLLGKSEPAEIAAKLNQRFALDRTPCAVVQRLKRRGKSRWMEGYSLRDLERLFGMDHRTIVRRWIEPGLLVGRRWSGRGPHPGWFFDAMVVVAFSRNHCRLADPDKMRRRRVSPDYVRSAQLRGATSHMSTAACSSRSIPSATNEDEELAIASDPAE